MLLHWMQQTSNTGQQEQKSLRGYRKALDRLQVVGQYEGLWAVIYHSYELSIIWQSDHFDPLELVGGKCLLSPMDDKRDKNNMIGLLSRDTQSRRANIEETQCGAFGRWGQDTCLEEEGDPILCDKTYSFRGWYTMYPRLDTGKKTLYHLTFTQNHGKANECLGTAKWYCIEVSMREIGRCCPKGIAFIQWISSGDLICDIVTITNYKVCVYICIMQYRNTS